MDRTKVKLIADAIENTVKELEGKLGVTICRDGTVTYGDCDMKIKFKVVENSATGEKRTPQQLDWQKYAKLLGLPESALGKLITLGGKHYTIIGRKPSCGKPVVVRRSDGKDFRTTVDSVLKAIGEAVPAAGKVQA
jgi:hypothetical protein